MFMCFNFIVLYFKFKLYFILVQNLFNLSEHLKIIYFE